MDVSPVESLQDRHRCVHCSGLCTAKVCPKTLSLRRHRAREFLPPPFGTSKGQRRTRAAPTDIATSPRQTLRSRKSLRQEHQSGGGVGWQWGVLLFKPKERSLPARRGLPSRTRNVRRLARGTRQPTRPQSLGWRSALEHEVGLTLELQGLSHRLSLFLHCGHRLDREFAFGGILRPNHKEVGSLLSPTARMTPHLGALGDPLKEARAAQGLSP